MKFVHDFVHAENNVVMAAIYVGVVVLISLFFH